MSDRYTTVFTLPGELYTEGAPLIISAGALHIDNKLGKCVAQLKFKSVTERTIEAVRVRISALDVAARPLGAETEYQYLDLTARRDELFGQKTLIPLPDASTRSFSACVSEVVFSDKTIWTADSDRWEALLEREPVERAFSDPEMVKQYRLRFGEKSDYFPVQTRDLWLCICGAINRKKETACHVCRRPKNELFAPGLLEDLESEKKARLELEEEARQKEERRRREEAERKAEEERLAAEERERKEEEARIAAEKAAKKRKKTAGVVTALLLVGVAAFFLITKVIPKLKYDIAVAKYGQEFVDTFHALNVRDLYKFGSYEQDNNPVNGTEDIEWLVLAKEGNRVLVISRYALDFQPYNEKWENVTWETCSLRRWLNETFLNDAFNEEEKALIPVVNVTADENPKYSTSPGNDSRERIFLLSISEVNKYFSTDASRACKATAYCYAKRSEILKNNTDRRCWWWLRSPGDEAIKAAAVSPSGDIYFDGSYVVTDDFCAVRPAMWIDLGT